MRHSLLYPLSIGIVAENKPIDTPLIQALPIELLNLMDGELHSDTTPLKSSGLNENETVYKVEVNVGSTIEAEWLGETNRVTSPNVRRGEQVMLYRTKDSDKYYWLSLGRDDLLRRLETVIYRYSGLPDNIDEDVTEENSYYAEVSTHEKTITVKTSKRNGEYCIYTVQLNPGKGNLTIQDDLGNYIQLDSKNTTIHAVNKDGSLLEINKKKIRMQAKDGISIATKECSLETDSLYLGATSLTVDCPESIFKGTITTDGVYTKALESEAAIVTPGISGAPFIPVPIAVKVPMAIESAKPVKYPF
jgi:hypothetical protein